MTISFKNKTNKKSVPNTTVNKKHFSKKSYTVNKKRKSNK